MATPAIRLLRGMPCWRASFWTSRPFIKGGHDDDRFSRLLGWTCAGTCQDGLRNCPGRCALFGCMGSRFRKLPLGDETAYQPERRGFDEVFIHGCGGIGQTYPGSGGDAPGNTYFDPAILHNGTFEKTKGFCTDVFFGRALQWIDAKRTGQEP